MKTVPLLATLVVFAATSLMHEEVLAKPKAGGKSSGSPSVSSAPANKSKAEEAKHKELLAQPEAEAQQRKRAEQLAADRQARRRAEEDRKRVWEERCQIKPVMSNADIAICREIRSIPAR